jgi:DNA-binding XRE family transcriptional regulator
MGIDTALRIKRLREYRNYTQQYMADSLDLSQNAYCKIENGTTKLTIDRSGQTHLNLFFKYDLPVSDRFR